MRRRIWVSVSILVGMRFKIATRSGRISWWLAHLLLEGEDALLLEDGLGGQAVGDVDGHADSVSAA